MSWRGHAWEFVVGALSWAVAIVALACVLVFAAIEDTKHRGRA